MHRVAITNVTRGECTRRGVPVGCYHLETEGLPGQGGTHIIEVDDMALSHRREEYGLPTRETLRAIVKEHCQRLGGWEEHPSHPWGGLRDDVTVEGV